MKQYNLSYGPRTECGISQFFKTNCTWQYSGRSESWAFSETVQKMSKITHAASQFSFLVRADFVIKCLNELYNVIELRFNIITNLLLLFLLFNGFSYNDVKSYKEFDTRDIFEYSCERWSWTMKTNGTYKRLKLQERLLKYNSVKHLRRQQFSFRKTGIKVSLKILSLKLKRKA